MTALISLDLTPGAFPARKSAAEMLTPTIRVHHPDYVEQCRKRLPWQLSLYLEHVKTISNCEAEMEARGMAFAKSSDAWGE